MNPRKWWIPLSIIFAVSLGGVTFIGYETYHKAPPIPVFVSENGEGLVITADEILDGQPVFQQYDLMDYGSMFGDGANRGHEAI